MAPSSCTVHPTEIVAGFAMAMIVAISSGGCAARTAHLSRATDISHHGRAAGVVPGSWRHVESLRPESPIVVIIRNGERFEGRFQAIGVDAVTLTDASGRQISVPRWEIDRILSKAHDGMRNGSAIGAGVGFIAGLAVVAMRGSRDGSSPPSDEEAPILLSGVGSHVGGVADPKHTGHTMIYVAADR